MAKVMISLPDTLLETLDEAAKKSGRSRSAVVRMALSETLFPPLVPPKATKDESERRRQALKELRKSFADLDFGALKAEDLIREERERRTDELMERMGH